MINTYNQNNMKQQPSLGKISSVVGNQVNTSSSLDINNIKVLTPFGMKAFPNEGTTGVILPLEDGSYVLLGNIQQEVNSALGEVSFSSSSGAYIKLKSNGDVEINSMVIAPNGTIR